MKPLVLALAAALLVAAAGCGGTSRTAGSSAPEEVLYGATSSGVAALGINLNTGALTTVPNSPFAAGAASSWVALDPGSQFVYSVTTAAGSPNVLTLAVNSSTGVLSRVQGTTFPGVPGFIAVDPGGANAYVASDSSANERQIGGYTIDPATHALTMLPGFPTTALVSPKGIAVDPLGRFVYVLGPGEVDVLARDAASGAVSHVTGSPFPVTTLGGQNSAIAVVPSGAFVLVTGFNGNNISVFGVDAATGALAPVAGSPFVTGPAPIALAVAPSGGFVYVLNQGIAGANGSVSSFTIDASGTLVPIGAPVLAAPQTSAIVVDSASRFVYVGNRGAAPINNYRIDSASGALTPLTGSPPAIPTGLRNLIVWPRQLAP